MLLASDGTSGGRDELAPVPEDLSRLLQEQWGEMESLLAGKDRRRGLQDDATGRKTCASVYSMGKSHMCAKGWPEAACRLCCAEGKLCVRKDTEGNWWVRPLPRGQRGGNVKPEASLYWAQPGTGGSLPGVYFRSVKEMTTALASPST